jgi:adenylate cyclase
MKVLVAEDHPDNRDILYETLITAGYEPIMVTNGVEAVAASQEHLPDLIILDVNMPKMDGFAACAIIKETPETYQIPVIMLTAQSDIDSRVRGLGLGAEDYVSKPFSPKELLARVDARLRSKAESDELRKQRQQLRLIFERFVAPDIVQALMESPESAQLGGALREITVLFADLEGFTALSERTDPGEVLNLLNSYHGLMVENIKRFGGTVDKFLGDGIMAIYNAPVELNDHPMRAVLTAYHIQQALSSFQQKFAGSFKLNINFGIHTGNAVVGNIGTLDVMDYTAIGDTVNLAQRLQSISHGNIICISEDTYQRIAARVEATSDGLRSIKGRKQQVHTYTITNILEETLAQ